MTSLAPLLEHAVGGEARHEERGLRVFRARQLLDGSVEAERREREAENAIRLVEDLARLRVPLRECAPHPDRLRSLPREEERGAYHSTTAAAQVKPPPKVTISTRSPLRMRPPRFASSSASGIDAAEVLP